MSVVKIIELVGSSNEKWKEVAENAVLEASKTVRSIAGMDIVGYTAKVNKKTRYSYRTNVKIALTVEDNESQRCLLRPRSLFRFYFVFVAGSCLDVVDRLAFSNFFESLLLENKL